MGITSESEQTLGSSPEVELASRQEPEPPTSGNEKQSDTVEPLENFGFADNDSDGGISMRSDDASVVGGGGLSDDEFEVTFALFVQCLVCSFSASSLTCVWLITATARPQTSNTPGGFGFDRARTDSDDDW